jgi:hypothetical protein
LPLDHLIADITFHLCRVACAALIEQHDVSAAADVFEGM